MESIFVVVNSIDENLKQMKKILIPTDYSVNALKATHYAMNIAQLFNAEVVLVHSYHLPVSDPNFIVDTDKISEDELKKIESKKEEIEAIYKGINIKTKSVFGPIVDVLDKICTEEKIDLVVMGTKGQTNALESFIGTVASNVINEVKCDVLVVPEEGEFDGFNEVVLATDYHKLENYNCFDNLIEILNKSKSTLAMVNIQKELDLFQIPTRTENRLRDLFGDFGLSKHFVQSDDVESSLEHFANTHNADLIVLTLPHYSFWQKIWHKSLTKKMALHSKIPVLVLKE